MWIKREDDVTEIVFLNCVWPNDRRLLTEVLRQEHTFHTRDETVLKSCLEV